MRPIERVPSFTLGEWIVEPELHQLRLGNETVSLEPRVMSVLLELAAKPQRVVSKEHLLRSVWRDTNVGDDALTRCISLLRQALKDDAHNPQYIKTIPRTGYCLLLQAIDAVEEDEEGLSHVPFTSVVTQPAASHSSSEETRADEDFKLDNAIVPGSAATGGRERAAGAINFRITIGLIILLFGGVVAAIITKQRANKAVSRISGIWQLTQEAGQQSHPALSSNGKLLAFVWARESGGTRKVYITDLGGSTPVRLSDLSGDEDDPVWSPDASHIAFLADEPSGLALYDTAIHDPHSIRKIYIPDEKSRWELGALSWSADGRSLFLADHLGNDPRSSILKIDSQTLLAEDITHPLTGSK